VRPRDNKLASDLSAGIEIYERDIRPLPGIDDAATREVLIEQFLASIHRVEYVKRLGSRDISPRRADPHDDLFDPLKAAVLNLRNGNRDEAFWLVFLSVHFGKHGRSGWRYLRDVYGQLGGQRRWDWQNTSTAPAEFRAWLSAHQAELRRPGGGFGNHRKYESLDGHSTAGTGAVVESYVEWVAAAPSHAALVEDAVVAARGDARLAFDHLYSALAASVHRFGRLARFDYVAMLGKLGLAPIEPGSAYLRDATGPLRGARALFGRHHTAATLDRWLVEIDVELRVGMQVLEDALCNWQKSPHKFEQFRG
jgi:hypothetical protein